MNMKGRKLVMAMMVALTACAVPVVAHPHEPGERWCAVCVDIGFLTVCYGCSG